MCEEPRQLTQLGRIGEIKEKSHGLTSAYKEIIRGKDEIENVYEFEITNIKKNTATGADRYSQTEGLT